jgi:hypothetical protein
MNIPKGVATCDMLPSASIISFINPIFFANESMIEGETVYSIIEEKIINAEIRVVAPV